MAVVEIAAMVHKTPKRGGSWLHRWRMARAPEFVQRTDYLTQAQAPESLISDAGRYVAGWFDGAPLRVNVEDARAGRRRYQRWFHIQFDAGRYFVVANLVHLTLGSNTALFVLDKETGVFREASRTDMWPRTRVEVVGVREFRDPSRNSVIRQDGSDGPVEFDVCVDGLRLAGVADPNDDRPFIQCTGYHGGNGTMQWWGNLEVRGATLTMDDQAIQLPASSPGTYDLTWGHRRPVQNWNWLSATGSARREDTGAEVRLSLLSATDQAGAIPRVNAAKNNLWLDGVHHKRGELNFDYEIVNPARRDTGPWRIHWSEGGDERIDLHFVPEYRRTERRSLALLYDVDFHQHYGPLTGTIDLGAVRYTLGEVFALCEDSWMVM